MNEAQLDSLITAMAAKLAQQATQTSSLLVPKLPNPRELRQAQLELSAIVLERSFAARSKGDA